MIWRNRFVVALLLLALLALLVAAESPPLWNGVMLLLATLAAYEWGKLCGFHGLDGRWFAVLFFVFALLSLFLIGERAAMQPLLWGAAALFWVFAAPLWLLFKWSPPRWLVGALGVLLLTAAWTAVCHLYQSDINLLLIGMTLVWGFDILAFLVGRAAGKTPLAAEISPKKTVEGLLGGLYGAFAIGLVHVRLNADNTDIPLVLAFSLVLAVALAALVGDLFESWMKRCAGVKDSGRLLGDHGGVYDRVDALLPMLPLLALLPPW